jgi:hypothetical protein
MTLIFRSSTESVIGNFSSLLCILLLFGITDADIFYIDVMFESHCWLIQIAPVLALTHPTTGMTVKLTL